MIATITCLYKIIILIFLFSIYIIIFSHSFTAMCEAINDLPIKENYDNIQICLYDKESSIVVGYSIFTLTTIGFVFFPPWAFLSLLILQNSLTYTLVEKPVLVKEHSLYTDLSWENFILNLHYCDGNTELEGGKKIKTLIHFSDYISSDYLALTYLIVSSCFVYFFVQAIFETIKRDTALLNNIQVDNFITPEGWITFEFVTPHLFSLNYSQLSTLGRYRFNYYIRRNPEFSRASLLRSYRHNVWPSEPSIYSQERRCSFGSELDE